nr:hypothetical protein [Sphingopyxis flava]
MLLSPEKFRGGSQRTLIGPLSTVRAHVVVQTEILVQENNDRPLAGRRMLDERAG